MAAPATKGLSLIGAGIGLAGFTDAVLDFGTCWGGNNSGAIGSGAFENIGSIFGDNGQATGKALDTALTIKGILSKPQNVFDVFSGGSDGYSLGKNLGE